MTTLKSSDLGGKLEKKEEEEYYDSLEISLNIGLLMVFQCDDWRRLRWTAPLQIYLLLKSCRVTGHEVGTWGVGAGIEMEHALQLLLLWYKFLLKFLFSFLPSTLCFYPFLYPLFFLFLLLALSEHGRAAGNRYSWERSIELISHGRAVRVD